MTLVFHFSDETSLAVVKQVRSAFSLLIQKLHEDQKFIRNGRNLNLRVLVCKGISKATHWESLSFALVHVNVSQSEVLHLLQTQSKLVMSYNL